MWGEAIELLGDHVSGTADAALKEGALFRDR
jgi:hypothetical protein